MTGLTVGLVVGRPLTAEHDALHCGVRDYAVRLAQALSEVGMDAQILAPASWGMRDVAAFVGALRVERLDILHLQYPSIGHRRSLLPHLLGLTGAGRLVVTLHEHSALPHAQRAANGLFRATADRLVFTTDHEARAFGGATPGAVIPIGSNVPTHPGEPTRDNTVLYFGQIRADKGIEDFIALAALGAEARQPWRFVVIGGTPPRWRAYRDALRARAPAGMGWVEDLPVHLVAQAMATAFAAFLPFPDGAGLRRGSLLAALCNGLPVIAPFGPGRTTELRSVLLPARTPAAALAQLGALRDVPTLARDRGDAGRALARRFDWAGIAAQHAALYRGVLDAPGRPRRLIGRRKPEWADEAGTL